MFKISSIKIIKLKKKNTRARVNWVVEDGGGAEKT